MVFPEVVKVTVHRVTGEKENSLWSVSRQREVLHSFDNFKNEIVIRYPELLQYDEIKFFWIDGEGDEIVLHSHADYFDYMESFNLTVPQRRIYVRGVNIPTKPKPKPKVEEQDSPMQEPDIPMNDEPTVSAASEPTVQFAPDSDLPVHKNIICDVCDNTIRGHRYKCMQCFDYDLCMNCEAKMRHKDHLMLRIPVPSINRRSLFKLFDKLRSNANEATQPTKETATAGGTPGETTEACSSGRDEDYENCKRSKFHHRRHSKERDQSKERREEKERKERKHRRERSAKCHEERRSAHRRFGNHFNFSHLISQVIDPANIQSTFASAHAAASAAADVATATGADVAARRAAEVAAAAAAAAAESAREAAMSSLNKCPLFANASTGTSSAPTAASAPSPTTTTTAATAPPPPSSTPPKNDESVSKQTDEASATSSKTEEPQAKKSCTTSSSPADNIPDLVDLSWLAPTPESLKKINETFSKLLDPLGMSIALRSSGSNTPKPAQTQTPAEEKQDKTTETANTPTTSTTSQTTPVGTSTSDKTTEVDPVKELETKLAAALLAEPLMKRKMKAALKAMEEDDDDADDISSVSSVSLLTDHDDMNETSEVQDKRWSLVDIPDDKDEPILKKVETKPDSTKESTPEKVEEIATPSSQAPITPSSVPETIFVSSTAGKPAIDYEQLDKALKSHLEANRHAFATASASITPPTPASAPKVETASPTVPPTVSPPQNPVNRDVTYSRRPHVNHAVHAMIGMGFSNEENWLTQLLESVNGDIPRALDLLTPHKINP